MATERIFIDYVAGQLALGERLAWYRMFGEYVLYLDGKVVALACDGSVFIKPTAAVDRLAPDLPRRPPYPGARAHAVADELLDDVDAIRALFEQTAALLPPPRPKPTRAKPRRTPGTA